MLDGKQGMAFGCLVISDLQAGKSQVGPGGRTSRIDRYGLPVAVHSTFDISCLEKCIATRTLPVRMAHGEPVKYIQNKRQVDLIRFAMAPSRVLILT